MKVLGIIAEYNPFHNGHRYHIEEAKKITNADYVIVVMSGNFTQTGNIAIYDKFTRAKLATEYGVDLVIELPTIYANSSAESFAYGAVSILENLGIVDYICFGSETDNIETLSKISKIINSNNVQINSKIKEILKTGVSYPVARENALKEFLTAEEIDILDKSNNILGIEYLRSLDKLNSNITPICIKRESSDFNEIMLNENSDRYTSATSIRNMIYQNKIDLVEKYVPALTYTTIVNTNASFNDKLYRILKYKILTTSLEELRNISEVTEGLENKIKSEITHSLSYDDYINNLKSKRYTMTKIKRMLNNILLDITKDDLKYIKENNITYAHILSLGYKGKDLLSKISNNSNIKLITKINENTLNELDENIRKYLDLDILASNIYYTLNNEITNKDYTNRL